MNIKKCSDSNEPRCTRTHIHTKEGQFILETAPVEQTFEEQGIWPSLRGMGRGSAGARLWGMDRGSAGARLGVWARAMVLNLLSKT